MTKRFAIATFFTLALVFCIVRTTDARAQAPRTNVAIGYVSSAAGLDTNDCTTPVQIDVLPNLGPCKTFTRLLAQVADGGVGICVDAGSFGILSISRGITIDCKLGANGQNAAAISVNAPGKRVHLRNLSVTAVSLVALPVIIDAADSVEFDNVSVSTQNAPGSSYAAVTDRRTGPGKLSIRNSTFATTSDTPGIGILIAPPGGSLNAVIDNVSVRNSTYGMAVARGGRVMVNRSTFAQNSVAGIEADSGAIIEINDTLVSNNTTGVLANPGSTVALSNSSFSSNNTGVSGTTISYGNNRFFANAVSDGTAPTPVGAASSEKGLR